MPPESQKPKISAELKPIRTYESDVAEVLQKENITKAKIAIAEGKRKAGAEAGATPFTAKRLTLSNTIPRGVEIPEFGIPWKRISIIGAGVFVLLGIVALIYRFGIPWVHVEDRETPLRPKTASAFELSFSKNEARAAGIEKLQKGLAAAPVTVNDITAIPLRLEDAEMKTEELLSLLDAHVPAPLLRALKPDFTFGAHGFRGAQPFLLIPVAAYDRAFAGMLQWEEAMLDDIGALFNVVPRELSLAVGSSSATILAQNFKLKDVIIRNRDARALFTAEGAIVFLYSFIDKGALLITTNEDTLRVLLNKTEKGKLKLPVSQ